MCSTVSCLVKGRTATAALLSTLLVLSAVASQPLEQCGAAILDMLAVTPNTGISEALGHLLESDSRCSMCQNGPANSYAPRGAGSPAQATGQADFTWMAFPSWGNSLVFASGASLASTEPYASTIALLGGGVRVLPDIDTISSAEQLGLINAQIGTAGPTYSIYGMDYSGKRLEGTDLEQPQFDVPENAGLFQGNVSAFRGVVHPRTYLLTFYRADALARLHMPVPTNWEGLLALLKWHRQAVGQHGGPAAAKAVGIPEHGLCLTVQPTCGRLGDVLTAMAATVVQTRGTAQGYLLDLEQPYPAAAPLTNSSGWVYAATLLAQLLEYNAPDASALDVPAVLQSGDLLPLAAAKCPPVSPAFLQGNCLVTLEWDTALPVFGKSLALQKDGVLGVAPLPGSLTVVDPSGQLRECTAELCSTSLTHDLQYMPSLYTNTSSSSGGAPGIGPDVTAMAPPYIFNRAPYSALLDLRAEVNQQQSRTHTMEFWNLLYAVAVDVVYSFRDQRQQMTDSARAALGYTRLSSNGTAWDGARYASFPWWRARPSDFPMQPFLSQGLSKGTMESYVTALWHAVHHPNLAVDPPSPQLLNWYSWAIHWAAARLLPKPPAANTTTTAGTGTDIGSGSSDSDTASSGALLPGEVGTAARVLDLLTTFINMAIVMHGPLAVRQTYSAAVVDEWAWLPTPTISTNSDHNSNRIPVLELAVAFPVSMAVMLMVAAFGGAAAWLRRHNLDLLGRVRAPRVGSDTTLLVSDVQNSTLLWEQLDAEVMEEALHVHHAVFRGLLPKYGGYESATEGDSFLIAFPSPTAACAFAASVQLALLEAAWPEQLLAHPDGAELIVRVAKSNSKEQQKQSRQPNDDYLASTDVAYAPSTLNSLRRQPTANGGGLSFSVGNAPIRPTSSSRLGMASGSSPHAPGNDISAQLAHVPSSKLRHMQAYGPYRSHGPFASTSLPMATPPASGSPARRGLFETPPPSGLSPSASEPMPHIGLTVSGLSHLASGADTPVAGTSNTVPALLRAAAAVSDATTASERGSYGMGLLARQLTLPSQQQQQQHADEEISRGPVPRQSASAVSPVRCQQPQNRELLSPSLADTNHTSHHQQQQQRRQQQQAVSSPASAASSRQPTPLRIPPATSSQVALLMVTNPEAQPMDGPDPDTAGSNVIRPVLGPESSMQPRMSACDLGSFGISRTSRDTLNESDMEMWSPACVTWREALAAAFPIMADWPISAGTPSGTAAWDDNGNQAAQQQRHPPGEELRVVCRGFRVRMGLHSGLDSDQHVLLNKVSLSYKYYGPFAEAAHAANDTAPGGLIALSAAAFDRLKNAHKHRGRGSGTPDAKGLLENIVIVYAGHHDLLQVPPTGNPSAPRPPTPAALSRTTSSSRLPNSHADVSADIAAAKASALATVVSIDMAMGSIKAAAPAKGTAAAAAAAAGAVPDTDGTPLYVALPRALLCRLAHLPPLRTAREVQLGSLRAPTGCVCIGFVKVVGAGALMADVPAVATRALAAFHSLVCRLLGAAGGYLVEGGDGVALVALGSAARAVEWALGCVEQLRELDWDPELLAHELCEEVYTFEPMAGMEGTADSAAGTGVRIADAGGRVRAKAAAALGGTTLLAPSPATADAPQQAVPRAVSCGTDMRLSGPGGAAGGVVRAGSSLSRHRRGSAMHRVCAEQLAAARQLVYRGLRVKVGMDIGHVSHTLGAASARLEYRGKVMNRAARIAAFASAGQVCVSAGLWQAAEAAGDFTDPQQRPIVGHSMGLVPLKGVTAAMEIISCMRKGPSGRVSKG